MGIRDAARGFIEGLFKGNPRVAETQQTKASASVAVTGLNRPIARPNTNFLRHWAETNEWIRTAIDHRKSQVTSIRFDVAPIDTEKSYDADLRAEILTLFNYPDIKGSSFRSYIEPVVEDLLVLDAGCSEVVYNVKGYPAQLYAVDGATIRINPAWDGTEVDEPRYYWYPHGFWKASLTNREIIYMMQRPATYRVYGLSSIEVLQQTIMADLAAARYNQDQITQVSPQGLIDLGEGITPEQVAKFTSYYEAEIAGRKQTGVIGGTKGAQFIPFGHSPRDMQFLQWQIYLARKVAIVFGISPQDLGILADVNRANSEAQSNISEDRGITPLLLMIQEYLNREIVSNFGVTKIKQRHANGEISLRQATNAILLNKMNPEHIKQVLTHNVSDPEVTKLVQTLNESNIINLHFRFEPVNVRSAQAQASIHQIELSKQPYKTINEVRSESGMEPVEGGDNIIIETFVGATPLNRLDEIQGIASNNFANTPAGEDSDSKPPADKEKKSTVEIARELMKSIRDDQLAQKIEKEYIDSR